MRLALSILLVALAALAMALLALPGRAGRPADAAETMRIASLSPALTRMVVDLGLEDRLVGRSAFCDFVDPRLPVVGDLQAVDAERLLAVAPTHVLRQGAVGERDDLLAQLGRERGWTVGRWEAMNGLDDVVRVLRGLAATLAPDGALDDAAGAIVAALDDALAPPVGGVPARVLLVHSTDPVGVFGRGTWLSDALERLGGANAAPGAGWIVLSLEDVQRAAPDAIVIVAPGRGDEPTAELLGPLARLDVPAVRDGRVAVLDEPGALLPSTSVIPVARALAARLAELERADG